MFYTLTKLQGSQTKYFASEIKDVFYTLTKLQGSQTLEISLCIIGCVLHSYKITRFSNVVVCIYQCIYSFTLLQNYKVLKLPIGALIKIMGFTLLQNYKVLKLRATRMMLKERFYTLTKLQGSQTGMGEMYRTISVLHSYKITRFSNTSRFPEDNITVLHSYKITRFSNLGCCIH